MKITIGGKTKESMAILGIAEYPFSSRELSSKFRAVIKNTHPDSSEKTNSEEARLAIEAYKHLKNLAVDESEGVKKFFQEEAERDLFELTEQCPSCKGHGSKLLHSYAGPCPDCSKDGSSLFFRMLFSFQGRGFRWKKCSRCNGTGVYAYKTCVACDGSGTTKVRCKTCMGSGILDAPPRTVVCGHCNGRGKIVINPFNPVIPKAAVLGK